MRRSLLLASAGVLITLAARPVRCQEEPSVACPCQRHPESVFHPNPRAPCCADEPGGAAQLGDSPWLRGRAEPPKEQSAREAPQAPRSNEPPAEAPPGPSLSAQSAAPQTPPPPASVHRREPPPPAWRQALPGEPMGRTALRPWKWTALTGGLILAGGGAALLALDGRLGDQCWMPGDLSTCKRVLQTQPAGAALLGVGAAGLVGAVVLFTLDARHKPQRARSALVARKGRTGFSLTAAEAK